MSRGPNRIGLVAKGQFLPPVEIKNQKPLEKARKELAQHQAKRPDHLAFKLRSDEEQRQWVAWCDRKQQLLTAIEMAERGVDPWVNTQPIRMKTPEEQLEARMILYRGHLARAAAAETREEWRQHLRNAQKCKDYSISQCKKQQRRVPEFEPFPTFKGE